MDYQHFGYIPSTDSEFAELKDRLVQTQGSDLFEDIGAPLAGSGKGKLSMPFLSYVALDPGAFSEGQGGPDCTTHGSRNAFDTSRAVEIHIGGELESFVARGATEFTYWFRGHRGAGMSPAVASILHHKRGVLLRKKYEFADLTNYDFDNALLFNGNVPKEFDEVANPHTVQYQARALSTDEVRDALANGYGGHVGSQQGFHNERDENGIMAPSGSWNHDMAVLACDDTHEIVDETLWGIFNSWRKWNRGPWRPGRELVDGAGWVRHSVFQNMLRTGEVMIVGNFKGFPPQKLPDYASYWGS